MANLRANISKATYSIREFKGLNETIGYTQSGENLGVGVADGEAAELLNFRVTDEGTLTTRPVLMPLGRAGVAGELSKFPVSDEITLYESYKYKNGKFDIDGAVIGTTTAETTQEDFSGVTTAYFKVEDDIFLFVMILPDNGVENVNGWELVNYQTVERLWTGYINQTQRLIAATTNGLYSVIYSSFYDDWLIQRLAGRTLQDGTAMQGTVKSMFGFGGNLYILTGKGYYVYDGNVIDNVSGYIPVVLTACEPNGSGTLLERVNMLTPYRRARYSADGTSTVYKVVEDNATVTEVTVDGEKASISVEGGTVTFATAPAAGTDNIEITYYATEVTIRAKPVKFGKQVANPFVALFDAPPATDFEVTTVEYFPVWNSITSKTTLDASQYIVSERGVQFLITAAEGSGTIISYKLKTQRETLIGMKYAELYNGVQDNRVFLYGDGSNKVFYSGITENGQPSAEYFPDLNVAAVGNTNAPITAIVKHYNRLLAFKDNEAYSIYGDLLTLADGSTTTGFYITSINKAVGCSSDAQAILVENRVRTVDAADIYEWKATSTSGNISYDQRNATSVSRKVKDSLSRFDASRCKLFYDKYHHEFYCFAGGTSGGRALVQNIENGAWYKYDGFPVEEMCAFDGVLFCTEVNGRLGVLDYEAAPPTAGTFAVYRSGLIDYGKPHVLKYSPELWLSMVPERGKTVWISTGDYRQQFDFSLPENKVETPAADSAGFPKRTYRRRLKMRNFTDHAIEIKTNSRVTITGLTVAVSYANNVK